MLAVPFNDLTERKVVGIEVHSYYQQQLRKK